MNKCRKTRFNIFFLHVIIIFLSHLFSSLFILVYLALYTADFTNKPIKVIVMVAKRCFNQNQGSASYIHIHTHTQSHAYISQVYF